MIMMRREWWELTLLIEWRFELEQEMTVIIVDVELLPLLFLFKQLNNNQLMQNIQLFIVITSFVNIKDDITNTVSKTLQVIISQVTLLSLQIRSIAATANDIADITNMNLTNFIDLFYFKLLLSFIWLCSL